MQLQKQDSKQRNAKWRDYLQKYPISLTKPLMVIVSLVTLSNPGYTDLSNKSTEAAHLLSEIEQMQTAITDLKNAQEQGNTDQNLPLPASIALLSSQKANRDQLSIALERKTQENSRKRKEVEKLRGYLAELERNRIDAERFAREAEK